MKKGGRASAADLEAVAPDWDKRLEPPGHLTEAQAAEWVRIVDSLPADYFRPGDVSILAAFCVASAIHRDAQAHIEENGIVLEDDRGHMRANPAAQILQSQAATMAQLSVKLRLCPSSRYDKNKAANVQRGSGQRKRPWEM